MFKKNIFVLFLIGLIGIASYFAYQYVEQDSLLKEKENKKNTELTLYVQKSLEINEKKIYKITESLQELDRKVTALAIANKTGAQDQLANELIDIIFAARTDVLQLINYYANESILLGQKDKAIQLIMKSKFFSQKEKLIIRNKIDKLKDWEQITENLSKKLKDEKSPNIIKASLAQLGIMVTQVKTESRLQEEHLFDLLNDKSYLKICEKRPWALINQEAITDISEICDFNLFSNITTSE